MSQRIDGGKFCHAGLQVNPVKQSLPTRKAERQMQTTSVFSSESGTTISNYARESVAQLSELFASPEVIFSCSEVCFPCWQRHAEAQDRSGARIARRTKHKRLASLFHTILSFRIPDWLLSEHILLLFYWSPLSVTTARRGPPWLRCSQR